MRMKGYLSEPSWYGSPTLAETAALLVNRGCETAIERLGTLAGLVKIWAGSEDAGRWGGIIAEKLAFMTRCGRLRWPFLAYLN